MHLHAKKICWWLVCKVRNDVFKCLTTCFCRTFSLCYPNIELNYSLCWMVHFYFYFFLLLFQPWFGLCLPGAENWYFFSKKTKNQNTIFNNEFWMMIFFILNYNYDPESRVPEFKFSFGLLMEFIGIEVIILVIFLEIIIIYNPVTFLLITQTQIVAGEANKFVLVHLCCCQCLV